MMEYLRKLVNGLVYLCVISGMALSQVFQAEASHSSLNSSFPTVELFPDMPLPPSTGTPPIANADFPAAFDEDTAVTIDLLANDTDADGDTLALFSYDSYSLYGGSISHVTGAVVYTPPADYSGVDTFHYTIHDGNGNLVTGEVTLDILPVNDAPVCRNIDLASYINDSVEIADGSVIFVWSHSFTDDSFTYLPCLDAERDVVEFNSFDTVSAQGGVISSDGAGTITYRPAENFSGIDTFSYTVTDGVAVSTESTVTIEIRAFSSGGNFTMLDRDGNTFGGTNDVLFWWDRISFNRDDKDTTTNASMRSQGGYPFFGSPWSAHHIRIFAPGTYTFDTTCNKQDMDAGITDCNRALTTYSNGEQLQTQKYLTVTVDEGQIGALVFLIIPTQKT